MEYWSCCLFEWIGFTFTFSRADPTHLHPLVECVTSAKHRMINGRWPLDDKRPTLEIPSLSAHQVIIQQSPQQYEKRFGKPVCSLKMGFWKELINKQTILEPLTSWCQQHYHGRHIQQIYPKYTTSQIHKTHILQLNGVCFQYVCAK